VSPNLILPLVVDMSAETASHLSTQQVFHEKAVGIDLNPVRLRVMPAGFDVADLETPIGKLQHPIHRASEGESFYRHPVAGLDLDRLGPEVRQEILPRREERNVSRAFDRSPVENSFVQVFGRKVNPRS